MSQSSPDSFWDELKVAKLRTTWEEKWKAIVETATELDDAEVRNRIEKAKQKDSLELERQVDKLLGLSENSTEAQNIMQCIWDNIEQASHDVVAEEAKAMLREV